MSDGKFIFVEEVSKSYSTSGIVEYTEVYTHKDKGGRSVFVVKVDIENYLVSITGPSSKVWSQDVRENTDRAKKAKKWYDRAKMPYDRDKNTYFTPTYKE